jgi:hypothetical protein
MRNEAKWEKAKWAKAKSSTRMLLIQEVMPHNETSKAVFDYADLRYNKDGTPASDAASYVEAISLVLLEHQYDPVTAAKEIARMWREWDVYYEGDPTPSFTALFLAAEYLNAMSSVPLAKELSVFYRGWKLEYERMEAFLFHESYMEWRKTPYSEIFQAARKIVENEKAR